MGTLSTAPAPEVLIQRNRARSEAIYIDVNPVPEPGNPVILYDAAAVFASLRNLFLCPAGGRSRIFQEDYFSGLYDLLQEPMDQITAEQINLSLYQAVKKWEPRVRLNPSDIIVDVNSYLPGYTITVVITILGKRTQNSFSVPLSGGSFS